MRSRAALLPQDAEPLRQGLLPIALEFALVVAWSSGYIASKVAAGTVSVYLVLFWRFLIVAVLLAPFVVRACHDGLSLRDAWRQALIGFLSMFVYLALGVKSIALGVPAGTASLIQALQPSATAVLAGPVLGELVSRRQWGGLAIGFAGVAIAVGGSLEAPSYAYLLTFAATAVIVVATLVAKALRSTAPLVAGIGIQASVAALCFMPLAVLEAGLSPPLDRDFVVAIALYVVLSTGGAYGLYWYLLRRSTATRVSALLYLCPPVTMIWAWLMFGETLHVSTVAGLAICLVGVIVGRQASTANIAR